MSIDPPSDPCACSNFRQTEAKLIYSAAEHGSERLRRRCEKLRAKGLTDEQAPPAELTFEEQLALVASGKARLVEWPPRKAEPIRTLGGVCW